MSVEISREDFAKLLNESRNDPEFQFQVAICYRWGDGVEPDYAESVKWYKLAAKNGHAKAQFVLGQAYKRGLLGVEVNSDESIYWYDLSAKQGHARAQNNLAFHFDHEKGAVGEAIRLYSLADKQGYWKASGNLGNMFYDGKIVEQDLEKAKKYYEKALANIDFPEAPANEEEKDRIQKKLDAVCAEIAEEEAERKAEEKSPLRAKFERMAARTQVFISYAHNDMKETDYVDELRPHLEALQKMGGIKWWYDKEIKPGEKWHEEIQEALSEAKVAVLMVSANFFASNYVWNKELPKILKAAEEEGVTILWLPVRACSYKNTDIAKYQAVTDPAKPLARCSLADRDEVYVALAERIEELFK